MNNLADTDGGDDNALAERVSAFAPVVETQSLYLLRAFETTLDALGSTARMARSVTENARDLTCRVREKAPVEGEYLDAEDVALTSFESGFRGLETHLPSMMLKRAAAQTDRQLDSDQCDALCCGFDEYIEAIADLIDATKDLRAAIISHDLAVEPRDQSTFDSPEALIDSLRV